MSPRKPDLRRAGSDPDAGSRLIAPRWAKVERIRLIRREIKETLGPGAIDLLFAHGELVVEGSEAIAADSGTGRVYATLMLTIDLARCAEQVREPADAATAERLVELLRDADAVRAKLAELARPRLAELAGLAPAAIELSIEPSLRSEHVMVLIDGDAVAWPRARRRSTPAGRS